MCTIRTKKLRHWHMQFETPACMISFLYQNLQDTPSEIQDLYKSISMPDSQPLSTSRHFYWSWSRFGLTNKVSQQKMILCGHSTIFYIQKGTSYFLYYSYVKIPQMSCCCLAAVSLRSCVNCPVLMPWGFLCPIF